MKRIIVLAAVSGIFMSAVAMGKIEKKITFKKKIYATKVVASKKAAAEVPPSDKYVTVWVHGVNLLRPNETNLGLWPAYTFVENNGLFNVGKYLVEADPVRFPADDVLVFSWAGTFDYKECEMAAGKLYDALVKMASQYDFQNKKIRLIPFSYGGNIVFNLPKFKKPEDKLIIDEVVILAWPIQGYLVPMTKDPMFKKIFNVYSPGDIVQIIDPQGFCNRHGDAPLFTTRRLKRGENVLQTKILVNGRGCHHFGLCNKQFIAAFPMVIDELNDWLSYSQEHHLGLKRTRYILSIYADKNKARKGK
jgi:hypothetical protein